MSRISELAEAVGSSAQKRKLTVAVAESLTGGLLSSALAAADEASAWFRGAIVAYSSDVKHMLLQVPAGPVVSKAAATAMAESTAKLLEADVVVALTGVGGPGSQDGQPPGTVWAGMFRGVATGALRTGAELFRFHELTPESVCERACTEALTILHTLLSPDT